MLRQTSTHQTQNLISIKTPYKVLFLCTGNSARSIMAKHILRMRGNGRFESYSSGSHPAGAVNPLALELLERHPMDTSKARSKSWDEYRGVKFDFVINVCDRAKETCPIWPGQPVIALWGSPDPAAGQGVTKPSSRCSWMSPVRLPLESISSALSAMLNWTNGTSAALANSPRCHPLRRPNSRRRSGTQISNS